MTERERERETDRDTSEFIGPNPPIGRRTKTHILNERIFRNSVSQTYDECGGNTGNSN